MNFGPYQEKTFEWRAGPCPAPSGKEGERGSGEDFLAVRCRRLANAQID